MRSPHHAKRHNQRRNRWLGQDHAPKSPVVKAGQHALETADLRAQLVASRETNLLLLQVNELLSAAHKEAAEDGLRSQGSANRQGELLREASARYAQALSLTMTPGHAGSLAATPASDDSR